MVVKYAASAVIVVLVGFPLETMLADDGERVVKGSQISCEGEAI